MSVTITPRGGIGPPTYERMLQLEQRIRALEEQTRELAQAVLALKSEAEVDRPPRPDVEETLDTAEAAHERLLADWL